MKNPGRSRFWTLLFVISLTWGIAGCTQSLTQIVIGSSMPNIRVVQLSGVDEELATLYHNRATLLVFWATWCLPCRKEVPEINRLAARYAQQGLSVLGIAIGEPLNVVQATATQLDISYTVVIAPELAHLNKIGIDRVPKLILLNEEGRILLIEDGVTKSLHVQLRQLPARQHSAKS